MKNSRKCRMERSFEDPMMQDGRVSTILFSPSLKSGVTLVQFTLIRKVTKMNVDNISLTKEEMHDKLRKGDYI